MRSFTLFIAILCFLGSVGCGQSKWVGFYVGRIRASDPSGTGAPVDRSSSLTLSADKSFVEDFTPMLIEGTWAIAGQKLTLTPTKVALNGETVPREVSQTMYKPIVMTLEDDHIVLRRPGEEHIYKRK